MSKSLATVVYVNGQPYGPGPVDDDIAEQITNDKVWADEDADEAPADPPTDPPADPPAFDVEKASKDELLAEQITNDKVWADDSADEAPADPPADPPAFDVEKASKDELLAEIASRNEGRDEPDLIVVAEPGNKPELKAALAADNA
jgi:hypothetical protein